MIKAGLSDPKQPPMGCRVYGLPSASHHIKPHGTAGYRHFGIMTRPESVIAMHKSYFCLYQLRDFKRAMAVALDHFKKCEDGELTLMVVMDIVSKHLTCNPTTSLEHVLRICLDLLKSKNLVGLQRLLVRGEYDALITKHKGLIAVCNCTVISPVRPLNEVSNKKSRRGATKGNRVNLSLYRLPIIRKEINTIRKCREKSSESAGSRYRWQGGKRKCSPVTGTYEVVQQLKSRLIECYRDKNMVYYQIDRLTNSPIRSPKKEHRSVGSTDVSRSSATPMMSRGSSTRIGEYQSSMRFFTHSYQRSSVVYSSLRRINAQLRLENDKSALMERWRRHYRVIKRKIFQVCNMLFININVPFIAVDLLSRLFQNVLASTVSGIRRSLSYLFNCKGHPQTQDSEGRRSKDTLTEDDATMLFMLAANCLEIALKYHNAHARFDIFSLFYFLVFIDSILSKVDMEECLDGLLPSILGIDDMRVVLHQKLTYGRQYMKRSLKYHHRLFKQKLEHLSSELKKHRILQVASFRLTNCLEQLILLSHGIFGFNLTFRVAPVIIETTSVAALCGSKIKRTRCEFYDPGDSQSSECTMHSSPPNAHSVSYLMETWSDDECMDQMRMLHPTNKKRRSTDNLPCVNCKATTTTTHGGAIESLGVAVLMERLSCAPSSEMERVNSFLTESTEISILLLQMLSCSDYIEILSGNTMFTEPGGSVNSSTLMAAVALRFVLDVYIAITDETIAKMLVNGDSCDVALLHVPAGCDYIDAFKKYFGDYYKMVDANSCVFYFLMLDIDWIFHKEGLYTEEDYLKHRRLLSSVIDQVSPVVDQGQSGEVFDMHYRLYEKIALLMFGGRVSDPRTAECVDAFKRRSRNWSTFDEIVIREIPPEDELCINNAIMDIYYSDLGLVKTSFNPYKSIFTPKYFSVAKDLVYRVKAALTLYYVSQQQRDIVPS